MQSPRAAVLSTPHASDTARPHHPRRALTRATLCAFALALLLLAVPAAALAQHPPAQPSPHMNVPYGPEPLQQMDIYPAAAAGAPLVVIVHGGGWATNDKREETLESKYLQKAGFAVFNINYRLDGKKIQAFPMEIEDVEAATAYAIAHAATYNASTARVVELGGSAGGQLVGTATERMNEAAPATVRAVVTLSGPFDFPMLLQEDREGTFEKNFSRNIPQALGCVLETTCKTPAKEAWAVQWSPNRQVTGANCPAGGWQLFNSEKELIRLTQANAMTEALQTHGCPVTEKIVAGTQHSFFYWSSVRSAIVSFIGSV